MDGRTGQFAQVDATPQLSSNPAVTQPMKLVVDPHSSTRPKKGRDFTVVVRYPGTPEAITDADESIEGWIRACYPLDGPQTCDGAFAVNEPIGAQSWFPGNNSPNDKATFVTHIRVPQGKTALRYSQCGEPLYLTLKRLLDTAPVPPEPTARTSME